MPTTDPNRIDPLTPEGATLAVARAIQASDEWAGAAMPISPTSIVLVDDDDHSVWLVTVVPADVVAKPADDIPF